MPKAVISEKGQITLPAAIRRKMGWEAGRELQVEARQEEVVLRPLKTIAELDGIFAEYAQGKRVSWEDQRRQMEEAVGREVANE